MFIISLYLFLFLLQIGAHEYTDMKGQGAIISWAVGIMILWSPLGMISLSMICRFAPQGLTLPQPSASLRTSAVLAAARTPASFEE
ncbi:MAG: hypothetical protein C3F06_14440 [Candidatus Methanoperedenaceae archaeon]|nr:MAG: hypothetical protein C3F06_14440 [Candidatus Methanoperedenaceae archaeon]